MLKNFFNPSSIAVIGASAVSGKIGNTVLKNLSGFSGEVFGVNPKLGNFENINFFPSVLDLPKVPEIAIFAIPAALVEKSLEECGQKKIPFVVIISAGFKEVGNILAEEKLKEIAQKHNIRILGPNCLGFLSVHQNLNASFAGKKVEKGSVALVSQSGAMAVALMDWAETAKVGFSKIVSMGNKSDLDETDFLEFLSEDEETQVIVLYLESLEKGRKFFAFLEKISKKKPIVLVKSGTSSRGSAAIASHTGALAGEKKVLQTAFKQAGVHFTDALEKVFFWSEIFSHTVNRKNICEEVVLVTNAGGPGVMATDNAEKYGVKLANFSEEEQKILAENLSTSASFKNPVDILGDATSVQYAQILENLSKLKKKYTILCLLTPQAVTDTENIAEVISDFAKKNPENLVIGSFMGGFSVEKGRKILHQNGVLHFDYPRDALSSFAELVRQKHWEKIPLEEKSACVIPPKNSFEILQKKLQNEHGMLAPALVSGVFSAFSIPFAEEKLATTSSEAVELFEKINGEVVMKIVSPDIAHKTDCGGVMLHISTAEKVEKSFEEIVQNAKNFHPNANILGVSVQKMFGKSREVFVGMKRDSSFGDVIVFGLGGVFVNIFEDVSMRLAPVSEKQMDEMMAEIAAYKILQGARGESAIDFEAMKKILQNVQCLFAAFPHISEIDLNPVFVDEKGAWVIDGKIFCA